MIVKIDTGQSDQQERGWYQWTEQMYRLTDERRARHFSSADAIRFAGSSETGSHAKIKGVVGDEKRERNT